MLALELLIATERATCSRPSDHRNMADLILTPVSDWRLELPILSGRAVTLREPTPQDLGALADLLSLGDATRFGREEPATDIEILELVDRVARERASGLAFTYAITLTAARSIAGLMQVRRLDPSFEAAEWECTIAPSLRGSGVFLE